MRTAPQSIATIRRMACEKNGCQHDLSICDDLDSFCPNGVWGDKDAMPGAAVLVLNFGRAVVSYAKSGFPLPRTFEGSLFRYCWIF